MEYYKEANRFLRKYGSDAFKVIAAYEDAADISQTERYADWYGDYGVFEPSDNAEITYDKLLARYNAGLKYLGIIKEQTTAVCKEFLSEQLAEHIRVELDRHDSDAEYRPASILTKMKTFELTRAMLEVDADMEVDCDIGQEITAYIETWFDADKKFGIDTASEDGTWLNMYAKYDPFADTLRIECEISRDNGSSYFDYEPTSAESQLIKDMIAEKLTVPYTFAPAHVNKQRAAAVAALGLVYYKEGKIQTAMEHIPDYLRVSQAERERAEREKKEQQS